MQLRCEACSAPYRADDVSLALGVAKCRACDAVRHRSERPGTGEARTEREPRALRPKLPVPRFFDLEETAGTTRISWSWFRLEYVMVGAWGFALDLFSGALLARSLSAGDPLEPGPVAFLCLLLAGGLGLTYCALTGVLNTTTVEASRDGLSIRHGPLPWPGNQDLPRRALTHLYGLENARRPLFAWHGRGWDLNAVDAKGRRRTLLSRLEEQEQVLFLEQALEKRLGIEEAPVQGERAQNSPGPLRVVAP